MAGEPIIAPGPSKGGESRNRKIMLQEDETEVFRRWLHILNDTGIPYIVAGAFALHHYTGIWRWTKDLDIFLKPEDLKTVLDRMADEGFETEVRDVYWLAKARQRPYLLDLIFSVATNTIIIDDEWMAHSVPEDVLDVPARVIGLEELIASKIYVARSDRFDGADIAHIIRAVEGRVNWDRLLYLLRDDRPLLLWQLLLFSYIYPGHTEYLPQQLLSDIFEELKERWKNPPYPRTFCGLKLDPLRFAVDVEDWGYDRTAAAPPPVNERGEKI